MNGSGIAVELSVAQVREVAHHARESNARIDWPEGVLTPDDESFRQRCRRALSKSATSAIFLRGLMVMSVFPPRGGPHRTDELATALDMKYATVQQYLATLVAVDLVQHDAIAALYRRRSA